MSKTTEDIPNYVKVYAFENDENRRLLIRNFNCRAAAIEFINGLLFATNGFYFLSALNDIQTDAMFNRTQFEKDDVVPFPDKYTMPLSVLNLVLKPYHISIKEELK